LVAAFIGERVLAIMLQIPLRRNRR